MFNGKRRARRAGRMRAANPRPCYQMGPERVLSVLWLGLKPAPGANVG